MFIRSDNRPEFIAQALRGWCEAISPPAPAQHGVHRARIAVGKRIRAAIQGPIPRRVPQDRAVHHRSRGSDPGRPLTLRVQFTKIKVQTLGAYATRGCSTGSWSMIKPPQDLGQRKWARYPISQDTSCAGGTGPCPHIFKSNIT